MKRIAVFCDGTWNSADQPHPTNVRRMALMVLPAARHPAGQEEIEQVTLYFHGVGVPEGGGWLERLNEKISGGAMGFGLDKRIAMAYQNLARHYEPGDEIYVFGFSRGAYTARSLVGLIRNCGLPQKADDAAVARCFAHYRNRDKETDPDTEASLKLRLDISPWITTSGQEAKWRADNGYPAGHPFRVSYLGVWDTVGALGIPSHWGLPARMLNGKYRFHNTRLSRFVKSARHAVALDEQRRSFMPTLWTNLPVLRKEEAAGDYRQEWFAGVHGAVGGGGDLVSLSAIALIWIAQGAMEQGLGIDMDQLRAFGKNCDLKGPLFNQSKGKSPLQKVLGVTGRWRKGPEAAAMVADPAIARWRVMPERYPGHWRGKPYRPGSLRQAGLQIDLVDLATISDYGEIDPA